MSSDDTTSSPGPSGAGAPGPDAGPTAPPDTELRAEPAVPDPAPADQVPEPPLQVEPVEPGTPDPSAAVAASPILDPAAGQDAPEPPSEDPVEAADEVADQAAPSRETTSVEQRAPEPAPETATPETPAAAEPAAAAAVPLAPEPAAPDAAVPYMSVPEQSVPEQAAPGQAAPGLASPDTAVPEQPTQEPAGLDASATDTSLEPAPSDVTAASEALEDAEEPSGQLLGDDADAAVPAFRSARGLLIALVVTVVVLAALTAFLAVRSVSTRGGGGVEDARQDGLAAARSAARIVFSYDYRHLDKDFAAGKAVTTGDFAKEYQRTTSKLVDDVAARYKAVVVADISDAAVVNASKDQVIALVFLNQESTSTLNAGSKITQSRLEMTMVHRGDRWLVSKIKAF